jgi:hypothetical protein
MKIINKLSGVTHNLLVFLFLLFFISPVNSQSINQLSIISPGSGSSVTSPIALVVDINSRDIQLIRVSLIDENGMLLARQLLPPENRRLSLNEVTYSIAFDIPQAESPALLTVDVLDNNFQTQQTRSIMLILLSSGEAKILPNSYVENWVTIDAAEIIEETNGKQIRITGSLIPITDKPLHFELITVTGRVIGSRQLAVQYPGISTSFTIFIPIQGGDDPARLVLRQTISPYQTNVILDSYSLNEYHP